MSGGPHRAVTAEERSSILRLHHAEQWPVGTIAAELGRHHDTIELVLAQSGLPVTKQSPRPRLVDDYLPFIQSTLEKHPRLRASRLWAMVRQRGYSGSKSGFRAIISRLRPRRHAEAFLRRSVLAGQEGQVDWAHFGKLTIGRAVRTLWAFVMVLSYSRRIFLRFFPGAAMGGPDAVRAMGVDAWQPESWPADHERLPRPGSIRGLFSGGTLCDESMAIAAETLGPVMSNTPLEPGWQLPDSLTHSGHLMIDFGDDKLTQGRAHPMIDPSLRNARILEEAVDPSCAVILLDVVLGYGSHRHPADDLVPVMTQARETARVAGRDLAFVVSLVGTSQDPQGLDDVATRLVAAGASVHLSNAEATRQAVALIQGAVR